MLISHIIDNNIHQIIIKAGIDMKANSASKNIQTTQRRVPAGMESNLLSKKKNKLPTTGGYSKKTKIFSPASRGI